MLLIRDIQEIQENRSTTFTEFLGIGHVGNDARLKYVNTGAIELACLDFIYFINYPKLDNNCFKLTAWGDLAVSLSRRIKKGSKVFIQGKVKDDRVLVKSYEVLETLEETRKRQEFYKNYKK